MKILINTTPPTNTGGVANHYKGLKRYWSEEVYHNYIGGRKGSPGSVIIIYDILKFIYKCFTIQPDIILLNPSLGKTALMRDGLYLTISKILKFKTVLFIHGWDEDVEKEINNEPRTFVKKFNKADAYLVLASEFRNKLKEWGITKPIQLTTTKVDNKLVADFDISQKRYNKTLLFLARIESVKGIFVTLKAFKKIKRIHPNTQLVVAGNGSALSEAKDYVMKKNISNVSFKGYVRGDKLKTVLKKSDIYIFPTAHGEGMPTSVLEAMAFGLPVITRPVGGLVDFFKNGKMGYMIESLAPNDFADRTIKILDNPETHKEMCEFNYSYANEHFLASKVAEEIEGYCRKVLNYG